MQMGQLHYLPLTPSFFSILVGVFLILFFLLILGALRRAYLNLGVSSTTAMLLLLASLVGSYFNIPIAELSQERVLSDQVIDFFGMTNDGRCVDSHRSQSITIPSWLALTTASVRLSASSLSRMAAT